MDAVILVGGSGTRLRPLTYATPKPLIPVLNQPLIGRLISNLRRHGVERVILAASASERRIETALGDGSSLGVRLSYSYESQPLGSGLAVKQAAREFDGPFFVCNGDVITDLDLTAMAQRHREHAATLSISLSSVDNPSGFGVVELADADRIVRFVEKPSPGEAPSSWANAGTWIFERDVLDHIPDEKMDGSLERLVFPSLIADGFRVQGFPSGAYWMDVGTAERYTQLHADILDGRIVGWLPEGAGAHAVTGEDCQVWQDAVLGSRVLLGRNCRIGGLVSITGPTVLGDACDVRDKARIERSIIWGGSKVGSGAIVRDSIIGNDVWIGDDAVIEDAVIASGARVRRGARLPRGVRLEPEEVAG